MLSCMDGKLDKCLTFFLNYAISESVVWDAIVVESQILKRLKTENMQLEAFRSSIQK